MGLRYPMREFIRKFLPWVGQTTICSSNNHEISVCYQKKSIFHYFYMSKVDQHEHSVYPSYSGTQDAGTFILTCVSIVTKAEEEIRHWFSKVSTQKDTVISHSIG